MPPFKIYTQELADQLRKTFSTIKMEDSADNGVFEVVASTSTTDRHGERVRQDGWELDNYRKNPVMLVNHSYRVEAICGKATLVEVVNDQLIIKGVFAPNEIGQEMRKLYEAGFLKTVSVGFIVKSRNESDRDEITKQELLECSFVPVPANPEAVSRLKEFEEKFGIKFTVPEETKELDEKLVKELSEAVMKNLGESLKTILDGFKEELKTLFADGKAISDAEKEQKELVQEANRALSKALQSMKKR